LQFAEKLQKLNIEEASLNLYKYLSAQREVTIINLLLHQLIFLKELLKIYFSFLSTKILALQKLNIICKSYLLIYLSSGGNLF
jgi:hypothetical protein